MAFFRYRAITAAGGTVAGEIEGESRAAAVRRLEGMTLVPIDVVELKGGPRKGGGAQQPAMSSGSGGSLSIGGIGATKITQFTRELATLVGAGQPLAWSLETLTGDQAGGKLGKVVSQLLGDVKGGKSFADALARHPALFPRAYLGMVRAGEATGRLDTALEELADLREREERTRAKLISSLTYPLLLAVVAVGSLLVLLTVVVPQFEPLFRDAGAALPYSTQITIAVAQGIQSWGVVGGIAFAVLVLVLIQMARRESSARVLDGWLLRLPFLGGLARARATAQTCRVLGTLLAGGVELPQALQLSRDVVGNRAVAASLDRALAGVQQGRPLWACLGEANLLAPQAIRLCRIGEETGRLGPVLQQAAGWFETKLEERIQRLMVILEPAIVVTLGVTVAGVVLSILTAVLAVNDLAGMR